MTVKRTIAIVCDEPGGCPARVESIHGRTQAWGSAKRLGWVEVPVRGSLVPEHRCPQHVPKARLAAHGQCAVCWQAQIRVNLDGRLRSHKRPPEGRPNARWRSRCDGSGTFPHEVKP